MSTEPGQLQVVDGLLLGQGDKVNDLAGNGGRYDDQSWAYRGGDAAGTVAGFVLGGWAIQGSKLTVGRLFLGASGAGNGFDVFSGRISPLRGAANFATDFAGYRLGNALAAGIVERARNSAISSALNSTLRTGDENVWLAILAFQGDSVVDDLAASLIPEATRGAANAADGFVGSVVSNIVGSATGGSSSGSVGKFSSSMYRK